MPTLMNAPFAESVLMVSNTHDVEILRLKAETNRLEIAAYLALSELESLQANMDVLVKDLKAGYVVPFEEGTTPEAE